MVGSLSLSVALGVCFTRWSARGKAVVQSVSVACGLRSMGEEWVSFVAAALFLEHARTHAFGVGRQTKLVAVVWVLSFVFVCCVACLFCPSFLSFWISLFVSLEVFCLPVCSFSMFVLFGWCLSFLLRVCGGKGERGRGQSPGGYSSGFVSPGTEGPNRDLVTNARQRRGRTTPAHESSGKQQQPTAAPKREGQRGEAKGSLTHTTPKTRSGAGRGRVCVLVC